MHRFGLIFLAGGLLLPVLGLRAAEPSPESTRIKLLVAQLGSDRFADRQNAAVLLEKSGETALPFLREALKSDDLEVRRRADDLIPRIEARLLTNRALTPLNVRFACKDKTVPEAIAEFARQTGHPLQLTGDLRKLTDRRVTLDTGDTTFWAAFEQLCTKAGLRETESATEPQPYQNINYTRTVRIRGGGRFIANGYNLAPRVQADPTLIVEDGLPRPSAVVQAGSLRFRALPSKTGVFSDLPDGGKQMVLQLEVRSESRLDVTDLICVRINRATDESGHRIRYASDYIEGGYGGYTDPDIAFLIAQQKEYDQSAASASLSNIPISLIVDSKSVKTLGELSGTLSVRVRTPPEALVTIDDITKAVGKTSKSVDGHEVKVTECKREDDGLFKVKVEVKAPQVADPQDEMIRMGGRGRGLRVMQMDTTNLQLNKGDPNAVPFKLVNDKGQPLDLVTGTLDVMGNNAASRIFTLVYKPGANDSGPCRFEYVGRREVVIDVPFALKDVPLVPKAR